MGARKYRAGACDRGAGIDSTPPRRGRQAWVVGGWVSVWWLVGGAGEHGARACVVFPKRSALVVHRDGRDERQNTSRVDTAARPRPWTAAHRPPAARRGPWAWVRSPPWWAAVGGWVGGCGEWASQSEARSQGPGGGHPQTADWARPHAPPPPQRPGPPPGPRGGRRRGAGGGRGTIPASGGSPRTRGRENGCALDEGGREREGRRAHRPPPSLGGPSGHKGGPGRGGGRAAHSPTRQPQKREGQSIAFFLNKVKTRGEEEGEEEGGNTREREPRQNDMGLSGGCTPIIQRSNVDRARPSPHCPAGRGAAHRPPPPPWDPSLESPGPT